MKNGGKKALGYFSDKIVGDSGSFSSTYIVMAECELSADTYPYTFCVIPSTFNKGEEEEFSIEVLSTDKNF